ncbi:MAG TPA: MauE/DoxX family redox-associated membrane protein [Phycisphaerales bacterium]|nr:MauE/DoxX family redox-associated membrane protein [Phycisphaerales bacterium]
MNTTLAITGMHCAACVDRLTRAFERVPVVRSATVTLDPPRADIESEGHIAVDALQRAAHDAGTYDVSVLRTDAAQVSTTTRGHPHEHHTADTAAPTSKTSLYPLILIVAYIAGTVALIGFAQAGWTFANWSWRNAMNNFMAGFFLVFSFFKLLDLRGFASAYRMYDVVAKTIPAWAFIYPFVELALGVAYAARWQPAITNWLTLALMLLGSVGVLRALLARHQIRCACLGTVLNLPMTTVTLVEDLAMAAMAGAMLAWGG